MEATTDGDFRLLGALSSPVVVVDSEARVVYCNAEFSKVTGWRLAELRGRSFVDLLPTSVAGEEMRATQRLRSLVERAPYGIFMVDPDGSFADVNPAFCRMLGYSREEMVGKAATDLISPVDVERLVEAKALSQRHGSHLAEWNLTRKDGTQLRVEVNAWFLANGTWQGFVSDIIERKRLTEMLRVARSELALSRSRLRSIMDNAYQFIGLLAPDGTLLEANRSALRLIAAKREHTIGRPFWETAWWAGDPEQKLRLRHAIEAAARHGRFVRFDATHPAADGQTVHVDFSLTPVLDAHGNVIHIVPEGRDITDRKRVEAALRLSEARLSRLVSTATDAIISADEDQRVVLFNRGAEQIFGWKSEEILGQPLDLLIPARFRAPHRRHIRDFEKEGSSTRSMVERRTLIYGVRKGGDEFPIEAAIMSVEVESKHIFTAMLRDISKRVFLERELNRRLEQQSLLADLGATLGESLDDDEKLIRVAELIAATLAKCCIAYAARDGEIRRVKVACGDPARVAAAEELERHPLDAIQHSAVRALILAGQPRLVKELTPEVLRSLLLSEEHYARLAALEPRSGLAVPLVARGRPLGAFVLFSCDADRLYGDEDVRLAMLVAERTALSLDVLQSLRTAQDATQARDDLLAFVAHDLRNPLAVVDLTVQRLLHRVPADADEVRRGLATIARSAARASRLIKDLLDLRRPQTDLTLVSQSRSPQHLVAEALETQRPLVAAASLTLQIDVPNALPAVQADPDRIAQVLENLVGNAVKFTPAGGRISVGAANREQDVLFWVKDSGRGVPSKDLPHVFDPFWRADGPNHGSVGLGLPIARRVIEAHAGHIWVESEEGAGCTVSFTLPKTVAQSPAP